MLALFTQMPMDAAVCLALATLGISFVMSLFGLLRLVRVMKPAGVRHDR